MTVVIQFSIEQSSSASRKLVESNIWIPQRKSKGLSGLIRNATDSALKFALVTLSLITVSIGLSCPF